jgi:hypothetical protein
LWEMPDDPEQRKPSGGLEADCKALVAGWCGVHDDRREHPFVAEARRLVVRALKKGQPDQFVWIDESGVVSRVGSRPASPGSERRHNRRNGGRLRTGIQLQPRLSVRALPVPTEGRAEPPLGPERGVLSPTAIPAEGTPCPAPSGPMAASIHLPAKDLLAADGTTRSPNREPARTGPPARPQSSPRVATDRQIQPRQLYRHRVIAAVRMNAREELRRLWPAKASPPVEPPRRVPRATDCAGPIGRGLFDSSSTASLPANERRGALRGQVDAAN